MNRKKSIKRNVDEAELSEAFESKIKVSAETKKRSLAEISNLEKVEPKKEEKK